MSRRMDRVNGLLRQEISRVLSTELRDPRLSLLVSVTQVVASGDLRHARVLVSVMGGPPEKREALDALKSAAGYIHRSMRRSVALKNVPSLEFHLDDSIERGAEVLDLIKAVSPGPDLEEESEQ